MTKYESGKIIKARLGKYLALRGECAGMCRRIQEKRKEADWLRRLLEESPARYNADVLAQAESAVTQIEAMINHYAELVKKREYEERRVIDMLEKTTNDIGRRILYLHYIEGMSFNDIPEELIISDRNMWYKYKAAIDELCDLETDTVQ